jgi:hypothetical protein
MVREYLMMRLLLLVSMPWLFIVAVDVFAFGGAEQLYISCEVQHILIRLAE